MPDAFHRRLDCGADFAAEAVPDRPTVSMCLRFRSGTAYEPEEALGVARLVQRTVNKGTTRRDGRALNDAFDALGIQHGSGTGRETITFRCTCLPEFVDQAIDLHAEMLTTPTFPGSACEVAVELALQELSALEDEPIDLARKLIAAQAYGPRLGRDPLGERETLETITRDTMETYWRQALAAPRLLVSAVGDFDPEKVAAKIDSVFQGFGPATEEAREPIPLEFSPSTRHYPKDQEQEYMMLCWPGVAMGEPEDPVERVVVGILSGGMSARLFTEVREKQGLVYWVGAWLNRPRGAGMVHAGASTTPDRCDRTFATLLREIERLTEDLGPEELDRAVTGIVARRLRESDLTHARAESLADDLLHFERPIPVEEKLEQVRAVTLDDVRDYLETHRRDRLGVLTLGPKQLTASAETT